MTDKRWRILVVDDEPNNLQLMMQILNDYYQLAFAANGSKALEIAQKLETDLILLDIMMPDMDGYEVCKKLKAEERTRHIPVIFITARDDVEDETKGLELGAIDYIAKPISPSIVKARVKNHIELKIAREKIEKQKKRLEDQNRELLKAAQFREDVERITRHDLKTPLNAIIALPQYIRMQGNLSEEQTDYLKTIEEAGLRMLNMINLSLDLFRMERGMYQFHPDRVNLSKIINKIINEMQYSVEMKNLSVNILLNGNPAGNKDVFVQGETLLCYSMLANLIKNAFEASPEKEELILALDDRDEFVICIGIHNKGSVPEDIRERFFDKYITSGKKTGLGLGTYSARLIAEIQGGSIDMNTSDEKGTNVTVCLPKGGCGSDSGKCYDRNSSETGI